MTSNVNFITATSAVGNGSVISDGGSEVAERGVCWSMDSGPTIADNRVNNGTGIGSFSVQMGDLLPSTKYYVRAYAINGVGISYGDEKTFTTLAEIEDPVDPDNPNDPENPEDPEENTYTVFFDANGGVGEMENQIFVENEPQSLSSYTFSKEGFAFKNWNTMSDGSGTEYAEMQVLTLTNDLTLYAQWKPIPVGTVSGLFTIGPGQRIYFSKGNLQYQAGTTTWRFAENQWDFIGTHTTENDNTVGTVSGCDNAYISSSYVGWIDLFGWGTGDDPSIHTGDTSDYASFIDWGSNQISNGGSNQWRTLTIDEWKCLVFSRITASGMLYAKAEVNGVNGMILFPDDWNVSYFVLYGINTLNTNYADNTITSTDWRNVFETHGAVFLPAAGMRRYSSCYYTGTSGFYWTSTQKGSDSAYSIFFNRFNVLSLFGENYVGNSVRLVVDE